MTGAGEPRPCSELTRAGQPCKLPAVEGSDRCSVHSGGHPELLLTPDLTDRLCGYLRAGAYIATACRAVSLARGTFDSWMARGRSTDAGDELYREFRVQVRQSQATGEVVNVARIARAAEEDWHAAAWLLERTHPERYGPPATRLRLDTAVPVIVEEQSDDPFAEFDELKAKREARV